METIKQNEVIEKIELVKRSETFKLIIPADVEQKIRMACATVPDKEWSGVLFYTYKGSFEENDLQIICKDILVMDVGTATYTEWCANAEVIRYMAENELLGCQMGIIHSHNTMATFFSGTDTATLLSEGQDRNNLVSLIVNNEGTYSAAITRCVVSKAKVEETGTYQFFGEGEKIFSDSYETEDVYIEYFMLDIIREEPKGLFSFIDRLKEIISTKSKALSYSSYTKPSNEFISYKPKTEELPFNKQTLKLPESTIYNNSINDFKNLDTLILQLITGNICASFTEYADLNTWIRTEMTPLFYERFGDDISYQSDFVAWSTAIIEFILYNTKDSKTVNLSSPIKASILAKAMHDRIKQLPAQNIYTKTILKQLEDYYESDTI